MPSGSTRLAVLTLLVGATAAIAARLPTVQSEARADPQPPVQLPLHLGEWEGRDQPVPSDVQRALPSACILSRRYQCAAGAAEVTIVTGSDATVLHDPHDCLTGDGWEFITDQPRTVTLAPGAHSLRIRDVVMSRGAVRAHMWYWYAVGPQVYESTLPARLALYRTRLAQHRREPAAFVRLIAGGETDSARSSLMLADLARQIVARIQRTKDERRPTQAGV